MLTNYHMQFLHHMERNQARYLVIGGQARSFHNSTTTSDLDVWVDISEEALPALELCLTAWSDRYPAHWYQKLTSPLKISARRQLRFPDSDGCYYLTRDGELAEIKIQEHIDLLTSIEGYEFEDVYARCARFQLEEIIVPVSSLGDLETISPPKCSSSIPAPQY